MTMQELLDDLRANGWSVAAHNDYKTDDGRPMVFWLMAHEGHIWEKATGETDAEALQKITDSPLVKATVEMRDSTRMQARPIVRIRGNCGQIHASEEEWRNCRACDRPRPISPLYPL